MSLLPPAPANSSAYAQQVEKMTGMLWYQMLSAMNQNGMDADSLGPGGGEFQSMFMWNIAQNDFGPLDGQLVQAALRNSGEAQDAALPAPAPTAPLVQSLLDNVQASAPAAAPLSASPLSASPSGPLMSAPAGAGTPAVDLVAQAKNFAKSIWPQVQQAAQALGVPPIGILAQAALETGWGAAAPGHNLFGIKAAPGQSGSARQTTEMQDGVLTPTTANFRDYADPAASVQDYAQLLTQNFPNVAGQQSVAGFATALQQGGYATDSQYAAKILSISQSPVMTQVLAALAGTTPDSTPDTTQAKASSP